MMLKCVLLLFVSCVIAVLLAITQNAKERKGKVKVLGDDAIKSVLKRYNKYAYPGTKENRIVTVEHDLTLRRIVEFDTRKLVMDVWQRLDWTDPRLTWDEEAEMVRLPTSEIWTPDIVMYNNPHSKNDFEPNAVVSKDGKVFLVPTNRIETNNCKPAQDGGTECTFKFGSWNYDGDSIDLQLRLAGEMNLSEYMEHDVYNLVNVTAERNEIQYYCCPESYPDVTYKVTLQPVQPEVSWMYATWNKMYK